MIATPGRPDVGDGGRRVGVVATVLAGSVAGASALPAPTASAGTGPVGSGMVKVAGGPERLPPADEGAPARCPARQPLTVDVVL